MQETKDKEHKFGSAFKAKKYDSYHPSEPSGDMGNKTSTPEDRHLDASEVRKAHGPAHTVEYTHDHEGGKHTVDSMHDDGHTDHSEHGSAEEAYQRGGDLVWEHSAKRRLHPDQQGADSEESNYEQADTA